MVGGPENQSEDNRDATDGSDPAAPSENRLNVTLYTFDDITPEGGITLRAINTGTGDTQSMELTRLLNTISGVSKWEGWVDMSTLGSDQQFILNFVNADGNRALGLGKYATPRYRTVGIDRNTYYAITDESANIYSYVDTVRHWEDGSNGRDITVSGTVQTEDESPLTKYNVEAGWHHEYRDRYSSWRNTILDSEVSSASFEKSVQKIYTHSADDQLLFEDSLSIKLTRNFYHSDWTSNSYAELHDLSEIEIGTATLYANRYVDVTYAYSEDGAFTTNDETTSSTLATAQSWDFTDYDLYQHFEDTFDAEDADVDGNDLYVDPARDSRLYFSESADDGEFSLTFYGRAGNSSTDLVVLDGDVPQSVDLSKKTGWDYRVEVVESESPVIGVKTASGYALVKIDEIRKMTTEKMEQIEDDFSTSSTTALSVSPQREREIEQDPASELHTDIE